MVQITEPEEQSVTDDQHHEEHEQQSDGRLQRQPLRLVDVPPDAYKAKDPDDHGGRRCADRASAMRDVRGYNGPEPAHRIVRSSPCDCVRIPASFRSPTCRLDVRPRLRRTAGVLERRALLTVSMAGRSVDHAKPGNTRAAKYNPRQRRTEYSAPAEWTV